MNCYLVVFSAQYWMQSKKGNLVNKSGKWQYSNIVWPILEEENESEIVDSSSGMVLTQSVEGLVELEHSKDGGLGQKWTVGKKNKDGWFVITNNDSNQVLTADGAETTKVTGF